METENLYVGIDTTQYSNGLFKDGNTKELCVAVFSTNPESRIHKNSNGKRRFSILETFLKNSESASITLNPEKTPENQRPIIYSAARLTSFYIENVLEWHPKKVEIHIDGPLYGKEKKYLKEYLKSYKRIFIEGYKKKSPRNNRIHKKKRRTENNCTQPKIVLAADALSNFLFRKEGLRLFHNLDSRESIILEMAFQKILFEHHHLFR